MTEQTKFTITRGIQDSLSRITPTIKSWFAQQIEENSNYFSPIALGADRFMDDVNVKTSIVEQGENVGRQLAQTYDVDDIKAALNIHTSVFNNTLKKSKAILIGLFSENIIHAHMMLQRRTAEYFIEGLKKGAGITSVLLVAAISVWATFNKNNQPTA